MQTPKTVNDPACCSQSRVEELEALVSHLRHDVRGRITTLALLAERLESHSDPAVQKTAKRIADSIQRVVDTLNATYQCVPPRGGQSIGIG